MFFVFFRGTASCRQAAFRKIYGEIGNLRAIFNNKPFMCLTANKKTRKSIVTIFQLKSYKMERFSPERPNVKINIKKLSSKTNYEEILSYVQIMPQTAQPIITILYCSSLKICGQVYLLLKTYFSSSIVAMYHSKTPTLIKSKVMAEFCKTSTTLSLVLAKSALTPTLKISGK